MSNSRLAKNKGLLYLLFCLAVVNLLLLSSINLQKYLGTGKVLGVESESFGETIDLQKEIDFWKTLLAENPNYIDGWVELSRFEHALNNNSEAKLYLEIAKSIDPNSEKVDKLEDFLSFSY